MFTNCQEADHTWQPRRPTNSWARQITCPLSFNDFFRYFLSMTLDHLRKRKLSSWFLTSASCCCMAPNIAACGGNPAMGMPFSWTKSYTHTYVSTYRAYVYIYMCVYVCIYVYSKVEQEQQIPLEKFWWLRTRTPTKQLEILSSEIHRVCVYFLFMFSKSSMGLLELVFDSYIEAMARYCV